MNSQRCLLSAIIFFLAASSSVLSQTYDYWEAIHSGYTRDMEFDQEGKFYIFQGSDFYVSTDFGETWQFHSSVPNARLFELDYEGNMYCATNEAVFRCAADDTVWHQTNFPDDYLYGQISINSANAVFVRRADSIYYSPDGGNSYSIVRDMPFHSWGVTDSTTIFVENGNWSAEKSTDLGNTWSPVNAQPVGVYCSSPGYVVFTQWGGQPPFYTLNMKISSDNGVNWHYGLPLRDLRWGRVDPVTKNFMGCQRAENVNWDWLYWTSIAPLQYKPIGVFSSFYAHAGYGDVHFAAAGNKIYKKPRTTVPETEGIYMPLAMENKWQYLRLNNGGYDIIEIFPGQLYTHDGKQYYSLTNFLVSQPVRYDTANHKLLYYYDNADHVFMDFYVDDVDVFYQENSSRYMKGMSSEMSFFGETLHYKGYQENEPAWSNYDDFVEYGLFSPNIGLLKFYKQGGEPAFRKALVLLEAVIDHGDSLSHWTNYYYGSASFDTAYINDQYQFQIDSLRLSHDLNDSYEYSQAFYYFDSVWVEKAYIKGNDTLKQGKEFLSPGDDYITHPCSFTVDSTLLQSGYYFAYAIGCTDKALIPNTKRYPETGYYINGQMTGLEDNETGTVPTQFTLYQNYPNPFNPSTTIRFSLPEAAEVNLTVYDVMGNEIAVLVDEYRQAGTHTVDFIPVNLASGVYLYKLTTPDNSAVKKLLLMK